MARIVATNNTHFRLVQVFIISFLSLKVFPTQAAQQIPSRLATSDCKVKFFQGLRPIDCSFRRHQNKFEKLNLWGA